MAGIYIHIPFCAQKCIYCDFYSIVNQNLQAEYIQILVNELKMRISELDDSEINTIYIGGGTPSVINLNLMHSFINEIYSIIDSNNITEFTVEVNPDDVSATYINMLSRLGVNRISMGIQSFNDSELKIIKRRHSAKRAIDAFYTINECGISNISIDLIFGLPEQTIKSLSENIDTAIALSPDHISCYGLMYEEGTLLYKLRERGEITECNEDTYINMYKLMCSRFVNAGYEHYEISNFAKPDKYSIHNTSYWDGTQYLGIGAAAHSLTAGIRKFNPNKVREYIAKINNGECAYIEEKESVCDIHNDYIMTRLRTMWGINTNDFKSRFGNIYYTRLCNKMKKYIQRGEAINTNDHFILSESGMLTSDTIFTDLFIVD